MKFQNVIACVALATPFLATAQDQPAEDEDGWSGKATLGYLATSGNTENSTLNSGLEVGFATGAWAHAVTAAAITASENEVTTAEAYDLGWKTERELTEKSYLFGRLNWRKDNFGAYDTQFSQTLGYGRRIIDNDVHKLNAEVGAGARQSEFQDGTKENETILRGGAFYTWQFSETANFQQDLTIEAGDENTNLVSFSAVSAKLLGDLALVASFTVKHNTEVPPLTEKTDTYTALSLEYAF